MLDETVKGVKGMKPGWMPKMFSDTFLIHGSVEVRVPLYVFPLPARRTLNLILMQNLLPIL